jgi:hypothetical protein
MPTNCPAAAGADQLTRQPDSDGPGPGPGDVMADPLHAR